MKHIESSQTDAISARITELLGSKAEGIAVRDVRIGLGYCAVLLEDEGLGLAYTFRELAKGGCTVFKGKRPLAGRLASELLLLLHSPDPIEAAVGLACANALVNRPDKRLTNGDILDNLSLQKTDQVAMVGYFAPLVEPLRKRVASLTIIERNKAKHDLCRPTEDAEEILADCQVALVSATTIINHTLEKLLSAASGLREVALVGASTPLLPEAFRQMKVTLLSGVVAIKPQEILRTVSEGGGMRQFSPFVQKVCFKIDQ